MKMRDEQNTLSGNYRNVKSECATSLSTKYRERENCSRVYMWMPYAQQIFIKIIYNNLRDSKSGQKETNSNFFFIW